MLPLKVSWNRFQPDLRDRYRTTVLKDPAFYFFFARTMNIYVGNLPYGVADADLQDIFEKYGAIDKAKVIMDRESGRSKGFGFVEMPNDDEAQEAIEALDGYSVQGRSLKVNAARPREGGGGPRGNH